MKMKLNEAMIDRLLDRAIEEDIGKGDITTQACVSPDVAASGKLILKQKGVIAGIDFTKRLFEKIDPKVTLTPLVEEGPLLNAGTIIAHISGPARSLLTGERIALNLLRHTSGVASITAAYVKKVKGLKCAILDTRKTLPGLRCIEKYAVQVGGGVVHRWGLDDVYIIKNNHLAFLAAESTEPIAEAVRRVRADHPEIPIEIELVHLDQLDHILDADVQAIMLNNLRPDEVSRCVRKIRQTNKNIMIYFESSGAISLETIRIYAETGIDGIAVSALTHSVQALEIGMRLLI
jgi:nicotinate-nucleotide pyrophosphorylase (carboxylating)